MSWLVSEPNGCVLTIKVVPRASRNEVTGVEDAWLRIRLHAPPVDGRANDELVRFLAEKLEAPKRAIAVISGETGRIKRVRVVGLDAATLRARLNV